ncbi:MAG: App1 family protein [Planctomycetes bacterium]|nr:App1 family protein [Planctomycetota bacterium]
MARVSAMTIVRTAAFLACLPWALAASANDLSRDEEVVLIPTYAAFDRASELTIFPLHAWIFEPEEDSKWRGDLLNQLTLGITLTEQERLSPVFRQRSRMFLVDNERGQELVANVAAHKLQLPASEANGHIRHTATLPTSDLLRDGLGAGKASFVLRYSLEVPRGDPRSFLGRVYLIGAEGWSVVSDIDDTIKISNVRDKSELMRNTFLRKFKPVEGMAARYTSWVREGAVVHYVSGSPWQLYPALADFTDEVEFPQGTFHLRSFRLHDGTARDLLAPPTGFKLAEIEQLLKAFPGRKFAFVGDSGELDPEVYGELARRHRDQVRLIAIRNITDERLDNERMTKAYRDVPAERCLLFSTADELPTWDELKKRE